jgi:hypothetical protein
MNSQLFLNLIHEMQGCLEDRIGSQMGPCLLRPAQECHAQWTSPEPDSKLVGHCTLWAMKKCFRELA